MKPKNNKDVRNGYLRFSFLLAACIAWSVLFFFLFPQDFYNRSQKYYGENFGL